MPNIVLTDETYALIQSVAEPFVDTPDSVIARVFRAYKGDGDVPNGNGTSARGGVPSAQRQQDALQLPVGTRELTHTRLLAAMVDGHQFDRPDWNDLSRRLHVLASRRLGGFEAVRKATTANVRKDRYEQDGYRFLQEAGFSIQGAQANAACDAAFRLAKAMRIPLRVDFEWRHTDGAAHPGKRGYIEWDPRDQE